jgi:site-specific DNA-methyltransferase (adenine-specific)
MSEGKKEILNGNSLELLKTIESESIDLILTDPPYNTTDCKWDKQPIDWNILKAEFMRIIKPTGTICISVQNPFGFMVGGLFAEFYRHRWVWEKDRGANFQCIKAQPLRISEDVLIFNKVGYKISWNNNGKPKGIYNPQMLNGKGSSREKTMFIENKKSDNMLEMLNRKSDKNKITKNTNDTSKQRYPKEIIYFPVPYKDRTHPTQKPIALFEYLIKTYTNEGMLVLDCFGGSGTTAIACLNTNRQFIVMEKEQEYYDIILKRVGDFNKKFETQTLFGNEM